MHQHELIKTLQELRPAFEAEGVAHLALFGSRARKNDRASSDIDLLLDVRSRSDFSLLDLIGVEHIVLDRTGLAANAFVRQGLDDNFRSTIERDIIEIF